MVGATGIPRVTVTRGTGPGVPKMPCRFGKYRLVDHTETLRLDTVPLQARHDIPNKARIGGVTGLKEVVCLQVFR